MKFAYPELQATSVQGMRLYETPEGNFYPSITTVLGKTMPKDKADALKKWQLSLGPLADKKSKEAADKGTAVHLLAERFLKGEELVQPGEKFDANSMNSFNGLKLKLKKVEEVWGQEVALYSDIIQVAGRCDCIAMYKGKPCIIDFKTSGRIKRDEDIEDYRLQLTAYAIMHNEMFGTEIYDGVVLMSSDNGFPQEFSVNLLDYIDPLVERVNKFYANLQL